MAIHKNIRRKVYEKYEGHCAYCGIFLNEKQMHIDHINPKVNNGTDNV